MDEAFIVVSVISGIFGIIGLLMINRFWFVKERFKFDMDFRKKEADLNFKKMRRDLGLDSKPVVPPAFQSSSSPLENIAPLLSLAKNLTPETIENLQGLLGGLGGGDTGGGSEEPGISGIDGLLDFANKNPEIVKGFMSGLQGKKAGGGSGGADGFI
jgi:hypothetical protein